MSEERDFLARWSRRKVEARHEPVAEPEPAPEPVPAEPDERSDEEILEELGLPDPETLGPGADFRAFLVEAVPAHIKRRALRRLWTSNPVLANLDQLVDYGEDYTDAATVVENLQSAYQAGRGYLNRVAEAEAPEDQVPAEAAQDAGQPEPAADAGDPELAEGSEQAAQPEEAARDGAGQAGESRVSPSSGSPVSMCEPEVASAEQAEPAAAEASPAPSPPRRRMRFSFDEG